MQRHHNSTKCGTLMVRRPFSRGRAVIEVECVASPEAYYYGKQTTTTRIAAGPQADQGERWRERERQCQRERTCIVSCHLVLYGFSRSSLPPEPEQNVRVGLKRGRLDRALCAERAKSPAPALAKGKRERKREETDSTQNSRRIAGVAYALSDATVSARMDNLRRASL